MTEAAGRHQKDLAEMQQHGREANDQVRVADQARMETEMRCDALRRENLRLEEFGEQLKGQVEDEIVQRRRIEKKDDRLTEHLRVLAGRTRAARKPTRRGARGLHQSLRPTPKSARFSKKIAKEITVAGTSTPSTDEEIDPTAFRLF